MASNEATPLWCSSRLALTIIGFLGFVNLYALRVNMSFAIVCMTDTGCLNGPEVSNGTENTTCINVKNTGKAEVFDWDKKTQGLILGSFFWGYALTQLPGGWLAGRFGGKHVFGWSMLACALATLLMPLASKVGVGLLLGLRVIAGLGQGVVWPSMQVLLAHWVPPLERSKLSGFVYAGAQIGNVIAFPLSGLLCVEGFSGGWPSIFYVFGGLGVLWFLLWMFFVYDSPLLHPRITQTETNYIVNSLRSDIDVSKKVGEEALVCLFNGAEKDDLNSFRYKRYCDKVKKGSKAEEANNLLPTSAADRYHSLRVFFQIQEWKGDVLGLEPSEWGWEEVGGQLMLNTTDLPVTQSKLLEMFRCECRTGCSTLRCTCLRHGLLCSSDCSNCEGLSCTNIEILIISDVDIDLDNEDEDD